MRCTTWVASIGATCSLHVPPRRSDPAGGGRVLGMQGAACIDRRTRTGRPSGGAWYARRRSRDLDGIRALLRAQRARLDLDEVAGYFALFDRKSCSMSCSPRSMPKPSSEKGAPLAGGGGATSLPGRSDLSDWVELMDLVEALCPGGHHHQHERERRSTSSDQPALRGVLPFSREAREGAEFSFSRQAGEGAAGGRGRAEGAVFRRNDRSSTHRAPSAHFARVRNFLHKALLY